MLLRNLLHSLDDLLVRCKFALVDEHGNEFVGLGALRGAVGEGAGEGATSDWGPRDEADASIFTVRNLKK